ncbi:unnamed protein product [Trifolium pratense]|uniref:Uncharacterized protein n=1 Tax=Trifolium pratense TaxID=57577 RepID=A0ACB0I6J7_TRIPR|nr:unnamed protein product [Trifolium pratense]
MGGKNTTVMHNACEDSLLAAPIILDLVHLAELSTRIQFKSEQEVRLLIIRLVVWCCWSFGNGNENSSRCHMSGCLRIRYDVEEKWFCLKKGCSRIRS